MDKPFAASGNSVSQITYRVADGQHIASIQGLQVDKIKIVGSHQSDIVSNQPDSELHAADIFVSEAESLCGDCSTEDIVNILLGGLELYGTGSDSNTMPRSQRITAKSQEGYKWMKMWLRLSKQSKHLAQQAQQPGNATNELRAAMDEVAKGF